MGKFLLSLHPILQTAAIILALYGVILGLPRILSLHFGLKDVVFRRKRHALVGAISLFMLLGGMAGGSIMAAIVWQGEIQIHGHHTGALISLPFLLTGIGTGLYLYFKPGRRRVLPAVHAVNNGILLLLLLYQAYSGIHVYLKYVLRLR